MKNSILLYFIFLFFITGQVYSHGDLHKRIKEVTEQIKIHPDSAYLYLKRGKLYFQHESYKKSISDLKKSQDLGYSSIEQELLFAKVYLRLENYKKSLSYSDGIIEKESTNVRAIRLRALTYHEIGNYYESALGYENVLRYASEKLPENYLEASNAYELQNTKEGHQKAIHILYDGIQEIGQIISFYDRILELQLKHEEYDDAISTQLKVIDLMDRKERAFLKLCELYIANENIEKAVESLKLAKESFNELPLRIQNTNIMKDFHDQIISKEKTLLTN